MAPLPVVGQKMRRKRAECGVRRLARGPTRRAHAQKPGIEHDGVGAHRIEARELLAAGDHLESRDCSRCEDLRAAR